MPNLTEPKSESQNRLANQWESLNLKTAELAHETIISWRDKKQKQSPLHPHHNPTRFYLRTLQIGRILSKSLLLSLLSPSNHQNNSQGFQTHLQPSKCLRSGVSGHIFVLRVICYFCDTMASISSTTQIILWIVCALRC